MSKIEHLITEIEEYLSTCKPQALSGNKRIIVEKDVIDEMLGQLRTQTPEEIKRYQKIIANRDAILADAKNKADVIIENANRQTEQIVSEHEILAQAQEQANELYDEAQARAKEIVDQAIADADKIRQGAMAYTDDQLQMLQNIISSAMDNTQSRYNTFIGQLSDSLDVISENRRQLYPENTDGEAEPDAGGEPDLSPDTEY